MDRVNRTEQIRLIIYIDKTDGSDTPEQIRWNRIAEHIKRQNGIEQTDKTEEKAIPGC